MYVCSDVLYLCVWCMLYGGERGDGHGMGFLRAVAADDVAVLCGVGSGVL